MANIKHVALVKNKSNSELKDWFNANASNILDLSNENFDKFDFSDIYLKRVDFSKTSLIKANFTNIHFDDAILFETKFNDSTLINTNFENVSTIENAVFKGANLKNSKLNGIDLTGMDLRGTNFSGAELQDTIFNEALLNNSNFKNATLCNTSFENAVGFSHIKNMHIVKINGDIIGIDEMQIPWFDSFCSWNTINILGKLPIFGASYLALIFVPVLFSVITYLNGFLEFLKYDLITYQCTDFTFIYRYQSILFDSLVKLELPFKPILLLISTVCLASASTLYIAFCPSRIKEFSIDYWLNALNQQKLHYLAEGWRHRYARMICLFLYIAGASLGLFLIISKVINVAKYIIQNN